MVSEMKNTKVIQPNPLVNEKVPQQQRHHLADMMSLPKKYRPIKGTTPVLFDAVDPLDDPSKDEIIAIIGLAYPELISFIKDIDELKKDYAGACNTVAEMHRAAMGKVIGPQRGVIEDVEDVRMRCGRAMDVLRKISDSGDERAARFLKEEESRNHSR